MKGSTARRVAAVVLAAAFALVFTASAAAAPAVNGTFLVPGIETNNKIVAGPDGNMWATVANGAKNVARITPAGAVEEFELAGLEGTSGIALGPEGKLWVTATNKVASFSAADPKGTVQTTPIAGIETDHSIVAGPDGKMWVATKGKVLRFAPSTPNLPETKEVKELSPKDIDVAGSLIVIADAGKPRVVTFTTGLIEQDFPVAKEGQLQGVAGGPTGQIAFSDPLSKPEQIGLITPPNPAQIQELTGDPFGVAFGSDQAFWVVQFAQGGLTRLTTTGQTTFLGGLPKETARQIAPGPGNTLWVTLIKKEGIIEPSVARISGLEPPVTPIVAPAPETKIAKGPKKIVKTAGKRAKVKFRFSSTTAGATFQCALTKVKKVKKGKKAAKPQFKGCKSPKSYSLKPGKYRFSVRAVSAGVVDPSAATRSFRVVHVHKR
jgi:streptogramin lyase